MVGGSGGTGGGTAIPSEVAERLKGLATDDYQKRVGDYPRSGIPTSIQVWEENRSISVEAMFKNTSEKTADRWMRRFLSGKVGEPAKNAKYQAYQSGDYHDDWVTCVAEFGASS